MNLDKQQAEAVTAIGRNVVVVAGPGSGKTEVLCRRIADTALIGLDHFDPGKIAVVTLTNAAADEIKSRLGPFIQLWHCGTIHSLALKLVVNSFAREAADVTVLSESEAESLEKEALNRIGYKGTRKAFDEAKKSLLATGSAEVAKRELRLALLSWANLQLDNLAFTFDGLLYWAGKSKPERIDHLIVDEAQDCCAADFRLFNQSLFVKHVFMVGDPDQNIFEWRGSSVSHFLEATAPHPSVQPIIRLETNYRCSVRVCEAANKLIRNNRKRVDKLTIPRRGAPEGSVWMFECPTFADEMQDLGRRIRTCTASNETSWAVLCRTNLVAGMVREALGLEEDKSERMPEDWATARTLLTFLAAPMNIWNAAKAARTVLGDKKLKCLPKAAQAQAIRRTYGDITKAIAWETALNWLGDLKLSQESILRVRSAMEGHGPTAEWLVKLDQMQVRTESPVMTIHAAKGREFDAVFLPCFDADQMPGSTPIEEARRLAFVALTRAKHRVVLSFSRKRKTWGGGALTTGPSQFLREMGFEL